MQLWKRMEKRKHREVYCPTYLVNTELSSTLALRAWGHIVKGSKCLLASPTCQPLPNALHMSSYFISLTSTLQMRKMKHREVLSPAQHHTGAGTTQAACL